MIDRHRARIARRAAGACLVGIRCPASHGCDDPRDGRGAGAAPAAVVRHRPAGWRALVRAERRERGGQSLEDFQPLHERGRLAGPRRTEEQEDAGDDEQPEEPDRPRGRALALELDRKSTRLNSSH